MKKEISLSEADAVLLLQSLIEIKNGDFSKRLPKNWSGINGEIADAINQIYDQLGLFTSEVTRVAREVGTDGKLGGQAHVKDVSGTWKDLTDNVNKMANNLTTQVRNIADVTTAVAKGDLTKKITVDVKGEVLELKNTINIMVDQLNSSSEKLLAEREKELMRIEELERFRKLTVGRELKMIELKKEIETLTSQAVIYEQKKITTNNNQH